MKNRFKTNGGFFEWLVMPFELCNAVSTFIRLMNHVFRPYISEFVADYFDDILIYSKTKREHLDHLTQIMVVFDREKLFGNLKRCTFFTNEVVFLGHIVTVEGIKVDKSKVEAIHTWAVPKSIYDVQSFIDFPHFTVGSLKTLASFWLP